MKLMANYPLFRAEVKKAMALKDWNCGDLAKNIGYSRSYVYMLLNGGGCCSDKMVKTVLRVLDLPERLGA